MPDHLNIEITKRQTAYPTCACGNDHNLEYNQEILNNQLHLHNLSEAMRIESAFTEGMKTCIIIQLQCCLAFLM